MFPPLKLVTLKGCVYTQSDVKDAFAASPAISKNAFVGVRSCKMFCFPKRTFWDAYLYLFFRGSMYDFSSDNTSYPNNSTFSPVTFSHDLPRVGRLIMMVTFATIGTTLNGFFVASFFVEHTLRRVGLVFLACVGLTDMIITGGILPVSSVVLLSGEWDNVRVCNVVQCLGNSSVYCYSLFSMFAAGEDYLRVCCSKKTYGMIISCNVAISTIFVFIISFTLGSLGVYLDLDYDYCQRIHSGNLTFRVGTIVSFHVIPCIITTFCLASAYYRIRRRAFAQLSYRRSLAYSRDYSIILLNISAYVTFFVGWLPYLFTSLSLNTASDNKYYNSIWFGHGRAVLTTSLYSIMNRNFRRAFAHLFNYCCCKSSLSGPLAPRHRREYCARVRLLQPNMFIARSSQLRLTGRARAASLTRETQQL